MDEPIDLDDKVIAVFDTAEATDAAVAELRGAGLDLEVIDDRQGLERLDPQQSDGGLLAGFWSAATKVLSDEDRVMNHAERAVDEGHTFIVVDVSEADHSDVASILKSHGGHYVWHFGEWTYVRLDQE